MSNMSEHLKVKIVIHLQHKNNGHLSYRFRDLDHFNSCAVSDWKYLIMNSNGGK